MSDIDYAAGLREAYGAVPTYDQLRMNALQMQQTQAQTRQADAQTALIGQEAVAKQVEGQRQQAFQADLTALGDHRNPMDYRTLAARYPEFAKPLEAAAAGATEAVRMHKSGQFSQIEAAVRLGKPEEAAALVQREIDADKAEGKEPDPDDVQMLAHLKSDDPKERAYARGVALAGLRALNPETVGKEVGASADGFTLGPGMIRFDADNTIVASAPFAPQYREVGDGKTLVEVGGGDPASGGSAAGTRDVSRLINSDAGGGYVPDSVQTLGQFVAYGKALNNRGAKSSSAGTYQINGTTMLEFGPKALGPGWATAPFDAETQDRVGAAIFDWAKGQPDPAKALRGRWVSLTPDESAKLVKGGWDQARGLIARKESGGGPGASANAGGGAPGGARVVAVGAPKPGYRLLTPDENRARQLDPNVRYQLGPDNQISALGGQDKSQGQLKLVPAGQVKSIVDNHATLREIDRAITLLDSRPDSIGFGTGALGDWFTQRNDPKGVPVRAAVGKIGGKIIHDVSGAAVTLSESPRFQPYVPQITDSPATARAKLVQLRELAAADAADLASVWGPDNGYRGVKFGGRASPAAAKPPPTRGWGKATVVSH